MAQIETVATDAAPAAIGPYAQATRCGNLVFTSGQIALDASSGAVCGDDVTTQTELVLKNLAAVLEAAGSSVQQVVKTTVYLKDMNDFAAMNSVYADCFGGHRPARAAVEVARLPKDVLVEIDAIATISE